MEFDTSSSKVKIEGPKEDVEKARERIAAKAKELEDSMCVEELDIPTKLHKHIIGKAGANINRCVHATDVDYGRLENEGRLLAKVEVKLEEIIHICYGRLYLVEFNMQE